MDTKQAQDLGALFLSAAGDELEPRYQRMRHVVSRLDDEQLNWRPNEKCNSLANLAAHFAGNLGERYRKSLGGLEFERNRPAEFDVTLRLSRDEALSLLDKSFPEAVSILRNLSAESLTEEAPLPGGMAPRVEFVLQTLVH